MTIKIETTPTQRRTLTDEAAWQLADTLDITPVATGCGQHLGIITARPHPAGWFISARSRTDLSVDEAAQFKDFVSLGVYLLLTQGPQPGVWEPVGEGAWAAHPAAELVEMDQTELLPGIVPAGSR